MMNRILTPSASLAVAAFAVGVIAADKPANNTHTGVVVSTVDGKLTMMGKDKKEHTHTVAKDATITCDGKDCKLEDLKKDQRVTVTVEKQGDDVGHEDRGESRRGQGIKER